MIRVLITDDHAVVRRGIRQILGEEPDIRVVGEATNGIEVMEQLRAAPVDVVLLDLNLPGKHGLELLQEIRDLYPKTAVLILSMHQEDQFGVRSMKLGASGYMTKDCEADEMLKAIRKTAVGGKYISPRMAELLELELHGGRERPLSEILSVREFSVFRLIASGKTVGQIAVELSLSVKTVSNYRVRALKKLGMSTNAEIMHYAAQHGFLE